MKFDIIYTDFSIGGKTGDIISIKANSYKIIGYTDLGQSLLIKPIDGYGLFKLVKKEIKK